MITICFVYFKSLSLANLEAALYSVRKQDFTDVKEVVVLDNDTLDDVRDVRQAVEQFDFPVPTNIVSVRHKDPAKTHAWSTNFAVSMAKTPWVFFTRADFILDFDIVHDYASVISNKFADWNWNPKSLFVTSHFRHLHAGVESCEETPWRECGAEALRRIPGTDQTYAEIDTGVWLMEKQAFDLVGGLDERLTAWGHAQTHFQHKLFERGVEFVRIPEVLYYHPIHGGQRDIEEAHRQLSAIGVDIKQVWDRHDGVNPYR